MGCCASARYGLGFSEVNRDGDDVAVLL